MARKIDARNEIIEDDSPDIHIQYDDSEDRIAIRPTDDNELIKFYHSDSDDTIDLLCVDDIDHFINALKTAKRELEKYS